MDKVLLVIFGISLAYLVNHLANCLPNYKSLSIPVCRYCLVVQPWSAFFLGRDCLSCKQNKGWRFWFVLILVPILFLFFTNGNISSVDFWISPLLITYFCLVVVIDLEHKVIPDHTTITGILLGAIYGISKHGLEKTVIGGITGCVIFYLIYHLGRFIFSRIRIRGQANQSGDPIGFADVKLTGVAGLILGWPHIWLGMFTSILIGGVISIFYIVSRLVFHRYKPFQALPFGPNIIAAVAIVIIFF